MDLFERWKPTIDQTRSEDELLAVVRNYWAAWLPSELAGLDFGEPGPPEHAADIAALAVELKRCELRFEGPEEQRVALRELTRTFVHAAERLRAFRPFPAPPAS